MRSLDDYSAHVIEQVARSDGRLRVAGLRNADGVIVSSLKRYDMQLSTPRGPVSAVGIGAVFTPLEDRRQGHAARLIGALLERAKQEGKGAGVLYSDISPDYYARLGFITLEHRQWTAATDELPGMISGLELRPCSDAERLLRLYERSWRGPCVRIKRDDLSWRYWSWRQSLPSAQLLQRGGTDIGYAVVSHYRDTLWVADAALAEDSPEPLWRAFHKLAHERGLTRVAGWLREGQAGGTFQPRAREQCIPMLAPLDDKLADIASLKTHFASFDHF
jgi:predicted acetyltransferase